MYESGLIRRDRALLSLRGADLREADLESAFLLRADLSWANLSWANLSGAILSGADLSEADLRGADLEWALLRGANLSSTNLREANLFGAKLRDEAGVSMEQLEQLEQQVTSWPLSSLEGATLPNGQKYEDWLKDREGREDDGENK